MKIHDSAFNCRFIDDLLHSPFQARKGRWGAKHSPELWDSCSKEANRRSGPAGSVQKIRVREKGGGGVASVLLLITLTYWST